MALDPVVERQIREHEERIQDLMRSPQLETTSQPQWSEDSFYKREMRKWNKPYVFQEFPKMLLKAKEDPITGKYTTEATRPDRYAFKDDAQWLRANEQAERFDTSCQLTVADREEQERAMNDGWREGRSEALKYANRWQDEIAQAAAHRAYEDRNMSDKAKAEAKAMDESTDQHVAAIPEAPVVRRRGRRPKLAVQA